MIPEPSMIQALTVEGPALDIEPSAILTSSVDGSTHDTRTVHDSGPKHGRSSHEPRTFREMGHQHGRLGLGEWNHPRYQPPPWKVQHPTPAPSAIQALSMEGPTLDPRTIRAEAPNRGRFAASK